MNNEILNIIGDTHNVESLKLILNKYNNIISLGDIAAADTNEYLKSRDNYSLAWKSFMKGETNLVNSNIISWFKQINIEGWNNQLNQIIKSKKKILVNMGNSDLRMIDFFDECKSKLTNSENDLFKIIKEPKIMKFNNILLFFLPYSDEKMKLDEQIIELGNYNSEKLFVIAHCPAYNNHEKIYYEYHYEAIKKISDKWGSEIYYVHGHMHPNNSYFYKKNEISNVIFLTPKAEDSLNGMGSNHHVIELNTITGDFEIRDIVTGKKVSEIKLEKSFHNQNKWNFFNIINK